MKTDSYFNSSASDGQYVTECPNELDHNRFFIDAIEYKFDEPVSFKFAFNLENVFAKEIKGNEIAEKRGIPAILMFEPWRRRSNISVSDEERDAINEHVYFLGGILGIPKEGMLSFKAVSALFDRLFIT